MDREDPALIGGAARPGSVSDSPPSARRPGQLVYRLLAGGVAAAAAVVGLVLFLRVPPPDGQAQENAFLFRGWPKPEVALVITGQQHGYLQPCGCSHPQHGGLARRYNFMQSLRGRGWPVVAVDLGDIAALPTPPSPQTLLKYVYSMKALKLMDYTAVSFGLNEIRLPLDDALNSYALNNPSPRMVSSSLLDRAKKGDRFHETVATWEIGGKDGAPKVGVFAQTGLSFEREAKQVNSTIKFNQKTPQVLEGALRELAARKTELNVLLFQGKLQEASACAGYVLKRRQTDPTFPRLDVIVCLTEEDEPPGGPEQAGESMIVRIGHKGRYVGVVGAFRTGKVAQPWELRYQLVKMAPEFATPAGKEKGHPVMDLMEDYAQDVKDGVGLPKGVTYLDKFPRRKHPFQLPPYEKAKYVGSERCQGCHKSEYEVWAKSKHAHAYEILQKATRPKNRQYDGECVVCHVVGFGYETGYMSETATPKLKNVGCESCHGPCSEHVKDPDDAKIRAMINPYRWQPNEPPNKRAGRLNQIDISCTKCHDIDNSVHFDFTKYWPQIVHPMPKRNRPKEADPAR
jgi:hypothetical protein